jgi:hypothetical protein
MALAELVMVWLHIMMDLHWWSLPSPKVVGQFRGWFGGSRPVI